MKRLPWVIITLGLLSTTLMALDSTYLFLDEMENYMQFRKMWFHEAPPEVSMKEVEQRYQQFRDRLKKEPLEIKIEGWLPKHDHRSRGIDFGDPFKKLTRC